MKNTPRAPAARGCAGRNWVPEPQIPKPNPKAKPQTRNAKPKPQTQTSNPKVKPQTPKSNPNQSPSPKHQNSNPSFITKPQPKPQTKSNPNPKPNPQPHTSIERCVKDVKNANICNEIEWDFFVSSFCPAGGPRRGGPAGGGTPAALTRK